MFSRLWRMAVNKCQKKVVTEGGRKIMRQVEGKGAVLQLVSSLF